MQNGHKFDGISSEKDDEDDNGGNFPYETRRKPLNICTLTKGVDFSELIEVFRWFKRCNNDAAKME